MKFRTTKLKIAVCMTLSIAFMSSSASAAHYKFSQSGFTDGAYITGSFDAIASSPDGEIQFHSDHGAPPWENDELFNFSIAFNGNSAFGSFNTLDDFGLENFVYDIDLNLLELSFVTNPFAGSTLDVGYRGSTKSGGIVKLFNFDNGDTQVWSTSQPLLVSQVPLPAALGLFATGLACLGIVRRKRLS
jgi:hypothetical protein